MGSRRPSDGSVGLGPLLALKKRPNEKSTMSRQTLAALTVWVEALAAALGRRLLAAAAEAAAERCGDCFIKLRRYCTSSLSDLFSVVSEATWLASWSRSLLASRTWRSSSSM